MRLRLGRLLGMLLGLVAAGLLAGCDVTGTATLRSDDYVELNLRAVVDVGETCDWQLGETVRTEERRMWRGSERLCLLQGTVHKEELRRWGVSVTHLGERIEVSFNPLGVVTTSRRTAATVGIRDLAVAVEFPGQVQESTGIVEGTTVRFTDVDQLAQPFGLRAVGLDHAGPPWTLVGAGAAFGLGALATGLLWAWRWRVSHQGVVAAAVAAPAAATTAQSPGVQRVVPPGGPVPGTLLPSGWDAGDSPGAGGSGWERPGTGPPDGPGTGPPAPEHAKWAPPAS